jgi:hypothetical protein
MRRDTRLHVVQIGSICFLVAGLVAIGHAFASGKSMPRSLAAGALPVVLSCATLAVTVRMSRRE